MCWTVTSRLLLFVTVCVDQSALPWRLILTFSYVKVRHCRLLICHNIARFWLQSVGCNVLAALLFDAFRHSVLSIAFLVFVCPMMSPKD